MPEKVKSLKYNFPEFLGSGPDRGRCPVEQRVEIPSIHMYVPPRLDPVRWKPEQALRRPDSALRGPEPASRMPNPDSRRSDPDSRRPNIASKKPNQASKWLSPASRRPDSAPR